MLTQYLRGIPVEERLPDKWRDLFLKEKSDWPLTLTETDFAEAVAWSALLPTPPDRPENAARRNQRLREQYEQRSGEYAWEIMVAFARAAHVLLGHLDHRDIRRGVGKRLEDDVLGRAVAHRHRAFVGLVFDLEPGRDQLQYFRARGTRRDDARLEQRLLGRHSKIGADAPRPAFEGPKINGAPSGCRRRGGCFPH